MRKGTNEISSVTGLALVLAVLLILTISPALLSDTGIAGNIVLGSLFVSGVVLLFRLYRSLSERKQAKSSLLQHPQDSNDVPSSSADILQIQNKARSLEIIHELSAAINASRDLDDLLERFLQTSQRLLNAHAITIRLTGESGEMRLLASQSLHREVLRCEELLSVQDNLWQKTVKERKILIETDLQPCREILKKTSCDDKAICMVGVPVQRFEKTLGVYTLFVNHENIVVQPEYQHLLISIGRHLGTAIEKARNDENSHKISIMEERNRLAQELHDSLAQSLASLRFQVRVLDETLHQGNESALWQELEKIENSLDEANTELRGMITNFRAPMDTQGLLPALKKLIARFRNETGMQVFLQNEWVSESLSADADMEVLRIIQEALANIRKHSQAQHVRILLGSREDEKCLVLIEDDGIGMGEPPKGSPGEHIGLSIMEERAKRLGGELRVESESGDGTQVILQFDSKQNTSSEPYGAEVIPS